MDTNCTLVFVLPYSHKNGSKYRELIADIEKTCNIDFSIESCVRVDDIDNLHTDSSWIHQHTDKHKFHIIWDVITLQERMLTAVHLEYLNKVTTTIPNGWVMRIKINETTDY